MTCQPVVWRVVALSVSLFASFEAKGAPNECYETYSRLSTDPTTGISRLIPLKHAHLDYLWNEFCGPLKRITYSGNQAMEFDERMRAIRTISCSPTDGDKTDEYTTNARVEFLYKGSTLVEYRRYTCRSNILFERASLVWQERARVDIFLYKQDGALSAEPAESWTYRDDSSELIRVRRRQEYRWKIQKGRVVEATNGQTTWIRVRDKGAAGYDEKKNYPGIAPNTADMRYEFDSLDRYGNPSVVRTFYVWPAFGIERTSPYGHDLVRYEYWK